MPKTFKNQAGQEDTYTGGFHEDVITGTGTYTLAGAVGGFESFASVGNGNTTFYCCTDGTDFEVGIGTYTASGTTLARTTILQSSNSDSAVNWSSGTRTVFCTLPAEKVCSWHLSIKIVRLLKDYLRDF